MPMIAVAPDHSTINEPVDDPKRKNNAPGTQDLHCVNLRKIEDDDLPGDRDQCRSDNQFYVNHVVAEIERDVEENLDGD